MINPEHWLEANGYKSTHVGQELILPEILAVLHDCTMIWLPLNYIIGPDTFIALRLALSALGHTISLISDGGFSNADAVYIGTPTIVEEHVLFQFAGHEVWTKKHERSYVRSIAEIAEQKRMLLVTGLGSGDISVEERLSDMGGGYVVCHKVFDGFEDWVLVRDNRTGDDE